ncbi:hypothetical protein [Natrarchaeobius chitinivorans]|uniref:Uncharacterized protein n=1 Tax=Natrarchaeobius chitinivorans TaxID=1679083 RepID=A0A3N6MLJ3_NATCH|nr:hypothetical protein [Natrarchaeobius chitinivorans]RQG95216.1 hypothetical protein EA473_09750 [Natrarchaeobius chitinivorans]
MSLDSIVVSSIAPFDPTIAITAIASVALVVFVGIMVFLAVAPIVSSTWTERLGGTTSAGSSLEPNEAD